MKERFDKAYEDAGHSQIDPDFLANPAFFSCWELLEDMAMGVGESSNTCIWSFMFLPSEFHQFNYLILNTRPHEDASGAHSVSVVGPTYHFISEKAKTSTIVIRFHGSEQGHFSSILLPNFKGDEIKKKVLGSCAQGLAQIKTRIVQDALWKPIGDLFYGLL